MHPYMRVIHIDNMCTRTCIYRMIPSSVQKFRDIF